MADSERDQVEKIGMMLLHRLVSAVGGKATLDLREVPKQIYWDINVINGIAHFHAMAKPPVPAIVAPSAAALKEFGKHNGG